MSVLQDIPAIGNRRYYRCSYCDAVFLHVDTWQRHNRKHTGLDIECEDCGAACSDHVELSEHMQHCTAYQVYMQGPYNYANNQDYGGHGNEHMRNRHRVEPQNQDPDSTSRSDNNNNSLVDDTEHNVEEQQRSEENNRSSDSNAQNSNNLVPENSSERDGEQLAQAIDGGSSAETGDSASASVADDDAIGIDDEALRANDHAGGAGEKEALYKAQATCSPRSCEDPSDGKDSGIFNIELEPNSPSGIPVTSPSSEVAEENPLRRRHRPYFCKNCGARFTRKDSVTRHLNKGTCKGKVPKVCNICSMVFDSHYDFYEHISNVHGSIPGNVSVPFTNMSGSRNAGVTRFAQNSPVTQHSASMNNPASRPQPNIPDQIRSPSSVHQVSQQPLPMKELQSGIPSSTYSQKGPASSKPPSMDVSQNVSGHVRRNQEGSYDLAAERRHPDGPQNREINLSEYTSNAMNSRAYLSSQIGHDTNPRAGNSYRNDPVRLHTCDVCGLEFPRFEYLLTHLRKHKEKTVLQPGKALNGRHQSSQCYPSVGAAWSESIAARNEPTHKRQHAPAQSVPMQPYAPNRRRQPLGVDAALPISPKELGEQQRMSYVQGKPSSIEPTPKGVPALSSESASSVGSPQEEPMPVSTSIPMIVLDSDCLPTSTRVINEASTVTNKCETCGQEFQSRHLLVQHVKHQTCHERSDFKCHTCHKTFRNEASLLQHIEIVHGDDVQQGEGSMDMIELRHGVSHSLQNHGKRISNAVGDSSNMIHRRQRQHLRAGSTPNYKLTPIRDDIGVTGHDAGVAGYCVLPRPFHCEYCGDRFAHRHSLRRHVRRHLGIGVPCNECGKLYRDQSEWSRHQRNFHRKAVSSKDAPPAINMGQHPDNNFSPSMISSHSHLVDHDLLDDDSSDHDSDSPMDLEDFKSRLETGTDHLKHDQNYLEDYESSNISQASSSTEKQNQVSETSEDKGGVKSFLKDPESPSKQVEINLANEDPDESEEAAMISNDTPSSDCILIPPDAIKKE